MASFSFSNILRNNIVKNIMHRSRWYLILVLTYFSSFWLKLDIEISFRSIPNDYFKKKMCLKYFELKQIAKVSEISSKSL